MIPFLLLLQTAAQPSADIVLDARAQIRDVRIRQAGETSLEVHGGPGSDVQVDKPQSQGRTRLRNVNVSVHAEARVADPQENRQTPETARPN